MKKGKRHSDAEQSAEPVKIANSSGFPLQIAIAKRIEETESEHGWSVFFTEHYWKTADGEQEGWIDLVLRDRNHTALMVIECKRPAEAIWSAFNDDGTNNPRRLTSALLDRQPAGPHDALAKMYHNPTWADLAVEPVAPEATFCVVKGEGRDKENPLLERISRDVLTATEALSRQLVNYRPAQQAGFALYFPVIVTTAELQFLTFSPGSISLANGRIAEGKANGVEHFRFRKQLSRKLFYPDLGKYRNVSLVGLREVMRHSLLVIRADALVDFLRKFQIDDSSIANFR